MNRTFVLPCSESKHSTEFSSAPHRLRFLAPIAVVVMIASAFLSIPFTTDRKAYGVV